MLKHTPLRSTARGWIVGATYDDERRNAKAQVCLLFFSKLTKIYLLGSN